MENHHSSMENHYSSMENHHSSMENHHSSMENHHSPVENYYFSMKTTCREGLVSRNYLHLQNNPHFSFNLNKTSAIIRGKDSTENACELSSAEIWQNVYFAPDDWRFCIYFKWKMIVSRSTLSRPGAPPRHGKRLVAEQLQRAKHPCSTVSCGQNDGKQPRKLVIYRRIALEIGLKTEIAPSHSAACTGIVTI